MVLFHFCLIVMAEDHPIKFITDDSGFYDLLERDDEVLADRGFQIKEELMLRFCF